MLLVITSDLNLIREKINNSRIVLISEDYEPGISNMPGVISLSTILPPSEIIYELLNDLEMQQFSQEQCKESFICQYQDYLNSNEFLQQTLDMINLSLLNNNVFMYVNENDMHNTDFPFFEEMLRFIVLYGLNVVLERDYNTTVIDQTMYSALGSGLRLMEKNLLDPQVVSYLLTKDFTRLLPHKEISILNEYFSNNGIVSLSDNMRKYYSKNFLLKRINGENIFTHNKLPAFNF